ncbi:hypothetical protein FYJ64_06120 [Clostridiales Family XIII bacterium WCA-MUC-591-APC-3H]|uniref:Uncharacterized protein n=2 Tax=Hornefia butyriciproducens TaxID=2652293 RepID=A0A6L5Y5C1_9FIRM|nr:hypothetical protein [Hornefia butyriciproducens]
MLQMNYSGAAIDSRECPERISAIVVGSKGNIKYYGNIATPVYPGGTATLNPDGKFDQKAGDKLYVFNEQLGGDKKTDYSSELKEINVPALSSRPAKVSIVTPKAGRKKVGKTTCYGVWSATRKEKLNKKTCIGQGYSTTLTNTFPGNFLIFMFDKLTTSMQLPALQILVVPSARVRPVRLFQPGRWGSFCQNELR